jgi:hypothetical protein
MKPEECEHNYVPHRSVVSNNGRCGFMDTPELVITTVTDVFCTKCGTVKHL